jgi:hypothetical protein
MKKILILLPIILIVAFFAQVSLAQYIPNETVNIIVQVSDVLGNPIDNANCSAYIFDPDFNLIFSTPLQFRNEFYVSNFTVPNKYGTYLEYVECNVSLFGKQKTIKSAKTFFVSSAFDVIERQLQQFVSNVSVDVTLNITGNLTEAISIAHEDIVGLILALHSTPESSSFCYNETHRLVTKTSAWAINDKTYNITKREFEFCSFGCDFETDSCKSPPYLIISIIIVIVIVVFVIYKLITRWL